MTPVLLIVIALSGSIETEKIEFRSMASCEAARRELVRDMLHLYSIGDGNAIRVGLSCVDRSADPQ